GTHVCSDSMRGYDQVAFVLAVLFVDERGHAAVFDRGVVLVDRARRGRRGGLRIARVDGVQVRRCHESRSAGPKFTLEWSLYCAVASRLWRTPRRTRPIAIKRAFPQRAERALEILRAASRERRRVIVDRGT